MSRQVCKTVYTFDELSDDAKEQARKWYREGSQYDEWWEFVYEDASNRARELGINLNTKAAKLMDGGWRYDPEIYFSGFSHQGSGSSFAGIWLASDLKVTKLQAEIGTESQGDKELRRLASKLTSIANEYPNARATINPEGDNLVSVEVDLGNEDEDELLYNSPEYKAAEKTYRAVEEAITKAMRDFNTWIYHQLEAEDEYRNADEQVDEYIRCNEYEFNESGTRA